jgi:hypothetical protein
LVSDISSSNSAHFGGLYGVQIVKLRQDFIDLFDLFKQIGFVHFGGADHQGPKSRARISGGQFGVKPTVA